MDIERKASITAASTVFLSQAFHMTEIAGIAMILTGISVMTVAKPRAES